MSYSLANVSGRAALTANGYWYDVARVSSNELTSDPMDALLTPDRLSVLSASLSDFEPDGAIDLDLFGPPVPRPRNVFAIGLNYQAHADEGGMDVPTNPLVFTKFPSCLVGPTSDIEMRSDAVDYEGELVVVIGPGGKDIEPDAAWDHIVGLMVGQDVSDRAVQFAAQPPHFDLGKSFDTFGPIGPILVSPDSVDCDQLRIVTKVNGEVRQDASTREMIFDIPTLVSYLSRVTTLSAGDLIFTGTPDGIGITQGKVLLDGDTVTTEIEGIGTLANRCVRGTDHHVG